MESSPVIVIASHQRVSITLTNIRLLLPYTVVLVITDVNERDLFENEPNVLVVMASNEPLGAKWQAGVNYARQIQHSHIVITGSDDILSKGFIEKYCTPIPFVGLQCWYVWSNNRLHLLNYLAKQPLGGGRVYHKSLLEKYDYQVFDTSAKKLLDDKGYCMVTAKQIIHTPEILSVKGDWPVMNPLNLKHKNVKLIATFQSGKALSIMKNKFGYDGI